MPRSAQKRSADPIQQALRDHKKEWNANCSEVIGQLIALKRGINGKGDAKIGLPPGSIKDPIPTEVSSLLSQLAGEFQQLVGGAQGIVQEQDSYSKNRRKPRPKGQQKPQAEQAAPAPNQPPTGTEQAVENLGRLGATTHSLEALGSNPLSRAWAYLSSIFSSKEFAKERAGLLSISADLYKHLLDFENTILILSKESIPRSISKYQLAKYKYEALKRSFIKIENMLAEKAKSTAPPSSPPQEPSDPIDEISQDIANRINAGGGDKAKLDQFVGIIEDYESETDPRTKKFLQTNIMQSYRDFLKEELRKKREASDDTEALVKVATNPIGRWLRRNLVKALKFNRTATPRLEVVEALDSVKKNIKELMVVLEGDASIEEAGRLIVMVGKSLEEMSRPMGILNIQFTEMFYSDQKGKKYDSWRGQKGKPPEYDDRFLDRMMNLKMRRDLAKDLK